MTRRASPAQRRADRREYARALAVALGLLAAAFTLMLVAQAAIEIAASELAR